MTAGETGRPRETEKPSRALQRAREWLANPDRLGGAAEAQHMARHGDCLCLPDLWLPTRGGYSDWYAIERCDLCDIRLYEAFTNDCSRVRRQEDEEANGLLPQSWRGVRAFAFLQAPPGQEPGNLVVCGCCWDAYAGAVPDGEREETAP